METFYDLPQAADSRLQNKINRSLLFHYLHQHGESTRVQISKDLRLSEPTVSRIAGELLKKRYLMEAGKLITGSGKRPSVLKLNPRKGYIVVADLAKSHIKLAATDFQGSIIAKKDGGRLTDQNDVQVLVIGAIRHFVNALHQDRHVGFNKRLLSAICIGMPADTDPETGAPLRGRSLYNSWYGVPFKTILKAEFKIPIFIERDVILSVLAEKNYGTGKDYGNIAYVEVSNGVATGIIIDNRLIRTRGALGFAGEAEYSASIEKEEGTHQTTHYDKYFGSIKQLEIKARERLRNGAQSRVTEWVKNDLSNLDASMLFRAAHEDDGMAQELIHTMLQVLSRGLANLILILNPEIVVIGGELSTMPWIDDLVLKPMRNEIANLIPFEMPRIEISAMHEDAILLGGAVAAMETLLLEEFPYKGKIKPL
jgi:predicted NBD/HSP70 family sugar kinase